MQGHSPPSPGRSGPREPGGALSSGRGAAPRQAGRRCRARPRRARGVDRLGSSLLVRPAPRGHPHRDRAYTAPCADHVDVAGVRRDQRGPLDRSPAGVSGGGGRTAAHARGTGPRGSRALGSIAIGSASRHRQERREDRAGGEPLQELRVPLPPVARARARVGPWSRGRCGLAPGTRSTESRPRHGAPVRPGRTGPVLSRGRSRAPSSTPPGTSRGRSPAPGSSGRPRRSGVALAVASPHTRHALTRSPLTFVWTLRSRGALRRIARRPGDEPRLCVTLSGWVRAEQCP